jgi:uroporphyrinogen-III decarboxylase
MTAVVDKWLVSCANLSQIGSLSHAERLTRALNLQEPDMVPVAPEAQLYSVLHRRRHDFVEVYQSADAATDAVLGAWRDLRFDLITSYMDIGHELEPLFPPARRRRNFTLRGPQDYVVFRPVTTDLDEAISLFRQQVWHRYGTGRAGYHLLPHCRQLAEFQDGLGCSVLVATGAASPSLHAETTVEAQNFLRWLVTEPKEKVHTYLSYVLEERLETVDAYRALAADAGIRFFYCIGGASGWGPRQWEEFGKYDRIFAEKVAACFDLPVWQYPGHNLLQGIDILSEFPVKGLQYDMPMTQYHLSYPAWFETVARKLQGKMAAMNSPTTQLALYGRPEQIRQMVRDFIRATAPYTQPVVMPGREIASRTPEENVRAMIEAARTYGKYPIALEGEDESLEDYPGRYPEADGVGRGV